MVREGPSSFIDNIEHDSSPRSASNYRARELSSDSAANSDGCAQHSSTDLTERETPETAGETKQPADESEAWTKGGSGRGTASPWPERDATQGQASLESGHAGHFSLSSCRSDEEYPVFVLDFRLKIKLLPNYRLAPAEARDAQPAARAWPGLAPQPHGRADPSDASQSFGRPSWPGPQTAVFSIPRLFAAAHPPAFFGPWLAGGRPAPSAAPAPRSSPFPREFQGARRFAPAC